MVFVSSVIGEPFHRRRERVIPRLLEWRLGRGGALGAMTDPGHELRRVAEAAIAEETALRADERDRVESGSDDIHSGMDDWNDFNDIPPAHMAWYTAASPRVVLALLDELERLRAGAEPDIPAPDRSLEGAAAVRPPNHPDNVLGIARPVADPAVVMRLEELSEEARSGKLLSFVICWEMAGGMVASDGMGQYDGFRMVGALEYAKQDVLHMLFDTEMDEPE